MRRTTSPSINTTAFPVCRQRSTSAWPSGLAGARQSDDPDHHRRTSAQQHQRFDVGQRAGHLRSEAVVRREEYLAQLPAHDRLLLPGGVILDQLCERFGAAWTGVIPPADQDVGELLR